MKYLIILILIVLAGCKTPKPKNPTPVFNDSAVFTIGEETLSIDSLRKWADTMEYVEISDTLYEFHCWLGWDSLPYYDIDTTLHDSLITLQDVLSKGSMQKGDTILKTQKDTSCNIDSLAQVLKKQADCKHPITSTTQMYCPNGGCNTVTCWPCNKQWKQ